MKKLSLALLALVLFSSHDMYLKLDSYILYPNTEASIMLYNGVFDASENVIDRDRMIDVSLLGNGVRTAVDSNQWREDDNLTILDFTTGASGTWVAGVSTKARNIEMEADRFNKYLAHDGVQDMLDYRRSNDQLEMDAIEKYAKHVKAIFQVGDKRSDDWATELGYPIEFIPLSNPYDLSIGSKFRAKLLLNGKPLVNQIVTIGTDGEAHSHDHADGEAHDHADGSDHDHDDGAHNHDATGDAADEEGHTHEGVAQVRTNDRGVITADITNDGKWYLRTIHMAESEEEGLTHESSWATLTFEVAHTHEDVAVHTHADGTTHDHDGDHDHHEESAGLPGYVYWLGSLAVVGVLFFLFNRKSE